MWKVGFHSTESALVVSVKCLKYCWSFRLGIFSCNLSHRIIHVRQGNGLLWINILTSYQPISFIISVKWCKGFINVFKRRVTDFHRAKLHLLLLKKPSTRWSNQPWKFIHTDSQLPCCLNLNDSLQTYMYCTV